MHRPGQDFGVMNDRIAVGPRPTASADATLCSALLESRQRWRDLVMTAADLAYETGTRLAEVGQQLIA